MLTMCAFDAYSAKYNDIMQLMLIISMFKQFYKMNPKKAIFLAMHNKLTEKDYVFTVVRNKGKVLVVCKRDYSSQVKYDIMEMFHT